MLREDGRLAQMHPRKSQGRGPLLDRSVPPTEAPEEDLRPRTKRGV